LRGKGASDLPEKSSKSSYPDARMRRVKNHEEDEKREIEEKSSGEKAGK